MASTPASAGAPTVGVATVSYRSEDELGPFLESLRDASARELFVAVADNLPGAPDSRIRQICESNAAHYLAMSRNLGYGLAMNEAVKAMPSSVSWVLISNPDVRIAAGTIDELVAAGELDEHIGAIGPAVRNEDGSVYPSARAIPSLRTGVGHALFANLWAENPWTTAYLRDSHGELTTRDAGWLSGSCVLVRRTVFERIGGFDPAYFMYFEDVDLGNRIGKAGFRNVYWPEASITHLGARSTTTESDAMVRAHHVSARRFLASRYPGLVLWPVRVALNVGLTVRSLLVRRRNRSNRAENPKP
jgi:N-acetylglucosaminyl-diphospho-decaprenol L-rhamnosyltransferase